MMSSGKRREGMMSQVVTSLGYGDDVTRGGTRGDVTECGMCGKLRSGVVVRRGAPSG